MSLVKLYRLHCEGPTLTLRKGRPEGTVQYLKVTCKGRTHELSETAKGARQSARRLGWTRRKVWMPLLPQDPNAGSSEIAFDLCPNCTELIPS
jgi:hypothetical protein